MKSNVIFFVYEQNIKFIFGKLACNGTTCNTAADNENIGSAIAERKPRSDEEFSGWLVITLIDGLMLQVLLESHEMNSKEFIEKFIEEFARHE